MNWLTKLFGSRRGTLEAFTGKAIPDVPEVAQVDHTERQRVQMWQETAIEIGHQCGRIRKGNSFAFTLAGPRSSVTVPASTFDQFVKTGIIDAQGNII